MSTLLFSQAISEKYKEVSEVISSVDIWPKRQVRKTFRGMMEESFFHGANRFGYNFIA